MMKVESKIIPGLPQSKTLEKYVILHEAGNASNVGIDSLDREVSYMTSNWENAWVTYFVGSGGRIVQLAPEGNFVGGAMATGNREAIAQIELARTNNKAVFLKDYAAYIWLVQDILKRYKKPLSLDIGATGAVTHAWVTNTYRESDHLDPYAYLNSWGITKAKLASDIQSGIVASEYPKKAIPEDVAIVEYVAGYGVQAWTSKGQAIKGKTIAHGSSWRVNSIIEANGKTLLNIGNDVYIDRKFTNIDDSVITINYKQNYGVAVWDDNFKDTGKRLKTGTSWKSFGRRWSDTLNDWVFNVGKNQWVRKQYTQFGNGI